MPSEPVEGMSQAPQSQHYTQAPQYQQRQPASPQCLQQHGPQAQICYTAGGLQVYLQQPQPQQQVYYTAEGQPVYLQPPQPSPQYAPARPQGFMTPQPPGPYVIQAPMQGYGGPQYAPPHVREQNFSK